MRVANIKTEKEMSRLKYVEPEEKKVFLTTFLYSFFSNFKKGNVPLIEISPYKSIDHKTGVLVDKENNLQVYLKVKTTDLVSMNYDDLKRHMNQLTNLCRVYHEPFKILSLTYSTETTEQQTYWKRMAIRYQNRLNQGGLTYEQEQVLNQRYSLAIENVNRVLWVEKNLKELAFFIIVYGKNQKDLTKNVGDMIRYGGRQFNLQRMPSKEVEKLVFKLQNMNSEM